jgi:hypothetical protein
MRVCKIGLAASIVLAIVVAVPRDAAAQGTAASIQGTIVDDTGPLPGATIVAKDTQSGYTFEAVAGADGDFTLSGLRPGSYEITVAMNQYKPQSRTVQVSVGQTITANFRVTPDVLYTEQVEVVGDSRLVETRTSQISTTVTNEQVRFLPQNQRNFLNFAALAPGAPRRSTCSSTASASRTTCSTAASSGRTRAGDRPSRRRPCRSSACSRRTTRRSTRRRRVW